MGKRKKSPPALWILRPRQPGLFARTARSPQWQRRGKPVSCGCWPQLDL